ncbi:MAG: divalent metal cation transporter, partial [Nevskiales bacterium]
MSAVLATETRRLPAGAGPTTGAAPLRRLVGPGLLVAVGYMDPGNWATDLEGGARFGYQLIWVLVMSNAMAI